MPRAILLSAAVLCGFLIAPTAGASPPVGTSGTCPVQYQPMTGRGDPRIGGIAGHSGGRADAAFDSVNKNGDAWIFQKGTPPSEPGFNWTDNQALGLGR